MADRMSSQYGPMFNNNLLQQQQQQQHQQQQQQQGQGQGQQLQEPHPNMPQDQPRMWQQMQQMQQQQQQQQQFNRQDMNSAQVAEFMKRQAARAQHQLQPFSTPSVGGPQQYDSQPPHVPPSFQNLGGNPNQPAAMQPRPQNIHVQRQLELMNMAQNQQPQNGPIKFSQQQLQQHQINMREQSQQPFQNTHSPADMFSSPTISNETVRRPSPHPGNPQQVPALQPSQPPQRVQLTPQEVGQRILILRSQMASHEQVIKQLQLQHAAVRGTPQEAHLLAKIKEMTIEYNKKKEYIQRFTPGWEAFRNQQQQASANAGGGPGQPSWIPHNTQQGQPFDPTSNPAARPQMGGQVQNQQLPSPSLQQSQAQANHLMSQGLVPPRSGPTPQLHQQPANVGSPFNNLQGGGGGAPFPFSSNNATAGPSQAQAGSQAQQGAAAANNGSHPGMPIPLDKTRFIATYKNFCTKKPLKVDPRTFMIENRQIDPHRLHVEVMKEGGQTNVSQKDLWPVIGGRLGFLQVPATDGEPARSGPVIGHQLAQIYQALLQDFDNWYTVQFFESQKHLQANNLQAQMNARWSPQQTQQVIAMSRKSGAELRSLGVDEKTIQFIEANRVSLQRTFQEQTTFQMMMRNANSSQGGGPQAQAQAQAQATAMAMQQGGGGSQSQGQPPRATAPSIGGPGASLPFANSPAGQQQNATATLAARNQFGVGTPPFVQGQPQTNQQQIPGGGQHMQAVRMQQGMQQPQGPQRIPIAAAELIQRCKHEYTTTQLPNLHAVDVPIEQRIEYNQRLDHAFMLANETEQKLQIFVAVLQKEEIVRKLIAIICTIQHQRSLMSSTSLRHVITLENLRGMVAELQRISEMVNIAFANMRNNNQRLGMPNMQAQHQQMHQQQLIRNNTMSPPNNLMATPDMPQARPPTHQPPNAVPSPQQQQQQQQNLLRPPPASLQPPPTKRSVKTSQGAGGMSTPSPVPKHSVSTPIADAQTPTAMASSPPATTKSPKSKPPPKSKAPTRVRRVSKAAALPTPPPAPEQTQPTVTALTKGVSVKRPREEEVIMAGSSSALNETSPPKRVKTEWESAPTETMIQKSEAVENIKTEEDASAFLEQMAELIKIASEGEGQESLTSGISETLEMILKGYGSVPNSADGAGNVLLGESSSSARDPTPPPSGSMAELDEFFDFSFGTVEDEDNNSKAPTPDLVSSSSTNPSPESNHELEASHHTLSSSSSSTLDIKTEELSNTLRLGTWKEIDGGEAPYYQSSEWKWDSPMPSFDQPWAIFNS